MPSQRTADSDRLGQGINADLQRVGDPGAGLFRASSIPENQLPDALRRALGAFRTATGTRVHIFRNLTPEILDFNGVNFRDGTVHINENSQNPATLTAAHEWVHNLRRTNPDLYGLLADEVARQGLLPEYQQKLRRDGETRWKNKDVVEEELTAAAVSDAMTDPAFLQRLSERDQGMFRRVARAFLDFLNTLTSGWRDQGSNAYLRDVEAFRDKLADVLAAYERKSTGPGGAEALKFVRSADQTPVQPLNNALAGYLKNDDWRNAYEAVELPDSLSGIREAFQAAFGRDIRPVAPTDKRFDFFNGIYIPSQPRAVYVNVNNNVGFVTIAGHELWHDIKRSRPELIAWYREVAKDYYKDVDQYQARMNALLQDGENPYTVDAALEELEADFLGDSLSDSAFLQKLAKSSPGRFRLFVSTVHKWLSKVVGKLKSLGSSQYVKDVQALQDHLATVLTAFAEGKPIPSNAKTEIEVDGVVRPTLNSNGKPIHSTQEGVRNFWRWFGDSKVVDEQGRPLVVYHGTRADFSEFDTDRIGQNFAESKGGFFFTGSQAAASAYASIRGGEGGNVVMPAYLSLQNPLTLDTYLWATGDTVESALTDREYKLIDLFDEDPAGVIAYAKDGGHDGIFWKNGKDVFVVAFRPEQIKSATGNSGAFDGRNADIRFSRNAPPENTRFDDFVYKMQNKQIDLKRITEWIEKTFGKISDDVNAYLKETLFKGRAAARTKEFAHNELEPLMRLIASSDLSIGDVEEYLHARHAKEANRVIAQRNPDNPDLADGGSGMKNAEADRYFANLAPAVRAKLEAVAKQVDAIIEGTRQLYVEYGLEDQETVDGWKDLFEHYIPLMREGKAGGRGIGQGFSVRGKETKGRTGSLRKVVDVLANIMQERERAITRGEKNIVATALVGLVKEHPIKGFWSIQTQPPKTEVFDPRLGKVVQRIDPLYRSRDNVLVAKVRGADGRISEVSIEFDEDNPRARRMAQALKNLDSQSLEGLLGASAKLTRYFSAINTQYNPLFGPVNLLRDVQSALLNLSGTPLAGQQAKIAADTVSALADVFKDMRRMRDGKAASTKWGKLLRQFELDGGTTGYMDMFKTSADRAKALEKMLNPDHWMESGAGKLLTANGTLKVPARAVQGGFGAMLNWLEDYNNAMENATRLAVYSAAINQGMSREQAAGLAKNITVNFNRKGQVAQQMGAMYAFFNAAVQGSARIGQLLFTMDGGDIKTLRLSKAGKTIVYGGLVLGVLQALALSAAGLDDEEPPEFVRERSLVIPTGNGKYVTIPMPLGYHVIPGVSRHLTEWALGGFEGTPKRLASMVGMFADAFNPIGNAGLSMQTLAPTALDPLVALTENKDFTGRAIARKSRNSAEPGHTQGKDTATWVAKMVAEAVNWITGGNDYKAGVFSPTADQIDYLIGQATGGVGRELSKAQQTISAMATGEELPPHKIPGISRFYGDTNSQSAHASRFYRTLERVNELETEVNGLRKDGRTLDAIRLMRGSPYGRLIQPANQAERQLVLLRKAKREAMARGDSVSVKVREEQMTTVMRRLTSLAGSEQ